MAWQLDSAGLRARVADLWAKLMERHGDGEGPHAGIDVAATAVASAPVVWMLGKVQSGKSSIVRAITHASDADIGLGFKPCTRSARMYAFPEEAPVIRFLDTRGLGETGYDPADDLAIAEAQAHLLIVVMRAMDAEQGELIAHVSEIRRRRPHWPIVVAQTCLHEGYRTGDDHIVPYPFRVVRRGDGSSAGDAGAATDPAVPDDLTRALAQQRLLFDTVPGDGPILFVPIDVTLPDDGLTPVDYGVAELMSAIGSAAPDAIAVTLAEIHATATDRAWQHLKPVVLGHATAAGAAGVLPVGGAIASPLVQARMLERIGRSQGVTWDRRTLGEFAGCLGVGVLAKVLAGFGARELGKLVPVYGQTVGSATAGVMNFATTYALGRAATLYLSRRQQAGAVDGDAVATAYRTALEEAFAIARARNGHTADVGNGTTNTADA